MEDEIEDASTSIHRWWWEFLRLSKDYWLVCQTAVAGIPDTYDEKLAQIYCDFGNIYDCSFQEWWSKTGSQLFKEQQLPPRVRLLNPDKEYIFLENVSGKLFVEIPLQLSKETVDRQISRLLNDYADDRPSNRFKNSTAKYPVNVSLARISLLEQNHEEYNLYRELIEKPKALALFGVGKQFSDYDERANLFRIGSLLHRSRSNEKLVGESSVIAKRANAMRAVVSRDIVKTKNYIANVEHGKFPSDETTETRAIRFSSIQDARHKELEAQWWSLDLSTSRRTWQAEDARRIQYNGD